MHTLVSQSGRRWKKRSYFIGSQEPALFTVRTWVSVTFSILRVWYAIRYSTKSSDPGYVWYVDLCHNLAKTHVSYAVYHESNNRAQPISRGVDDFTRPIIGWIPSWVTSYDTRLLNSERRLRIQGRNYCDRIMNLTYKDSSLETKEQYSFQLIWNEMYCTLAERM